MGKGRAPCCDKSQVKKGPWSPTEDLRLITFIQKHGHQNWRALPKQAGLLRCGKSCRLRWINYLRPDLRRGNFTKEEEDMIIKLHQTLGNKWSKIAAHLPGRTDNEIKNVWNTHFKKRLALMDANPESSSSTSSSSLSSSISVSGGNTSMGTELDDQRNQVFKSKRTKNCVKPKESSNSAMSSDMSNVTNSDQVDVTEQDKAEVQDMTLEVPLESDIDFWNMLDGLSNSDNDVPALDNVEESRSSNFGDTYLEEIENKRWLRYLETELGLEETPDDGNQENLPGDATEPEIPGDSMYDSSLLDPETDSELGYYHLWPSSLSITYK